MWLRSSWATIPTRFASFAAKRWAMQPTMLMRVFNKLKSCHAITYFTRVVCVRGFSGSKLVRLAGRPYCGWTRLHKLIRFQRRLPHLHPRLVVPQQHNNHTNHRQALQRLCRSLISIHITFLRRISLCRLHSRCLICHCHHLVSIMFYFDFFSAESF